MLVISMSTMECMYNEYKSKNSSPMICTYGYSHFIHFKTVATEVELQFLNTLMSVLPQFGSALFSSKEGGVPVLLSI